MIVTYTRYLLQIEWMFEKLVFEHVRTLKTVLCKSQNKTWQKLSLKLKPSLYLELTPKHNDIECVQQAKRLAHCGFDTFASGAPKRKLRWLS